MEGGLSDSKMEVTMQINRFYTSILIYAVLTFLLGAAQNGERWAAEDKELDKKLAELRNKNGGKPPNIVYILWDDQPFGSVGFPGIQKNLGYETPNLNKMADEGINFTRMYSEPACTPTRVAFLTGRIPVRNGMGVVGMPHEMAGLAAEEVTIAEVLSEAGMPPLIMEKDTWAILRRVICTIRALMRPCLPP